jgi:hypothetical protein
MGNGAAHGPTDEAATADLAGADPAERQELLCDGCDQAFKSPQGLAGHRRLAHSATTRSELETRAEEVAAREAAAKSRETGAARQAEAARRHEADVERREQEVAAAEAVPETKRLQGISAREIARLPEVRSGAILRVNGDDYRLSDNGLVHVYWPKGEKIEVEEGERFRFGGRPYCIRGGSLRPVPTSAILARLLGEED